MFGGVHKAVIGFPKVYAQEAQPPQTDPGNGQPQSVGPLGGMLPMLIIFIAIMYFLIIRPNQKREKERRELLASLKKGDRVVTTGGVCGTITGLNDKTVTLRVSDNPETRIDFLRGAVSQVTEHAEGE